MSRTKETIGVPFYYSIVAIVSLISFALFIFVILGYIQIGKTKKINFLIFLLILLVILHILDLFLGISGDFLVIPGVINHISLISNGLVTLALAVYFIRLSKFYKILESIGVLMIITVFLSLTNSYIPSTYNFIMGSMFMLSLFSYLILMTIIGVLEFKFFSSMVK